MSGVDAPPTREPGDRAPRLSTSARPNAWRGRPYTGGILGGLGTFATGIGWFYVVMAFLGWAMTGTLSWPHVGGGAAVTAVGVTMLMIAGYRHGAQP